MPPADDAARALVDYDERVARDVLDLILDRLGAPADGGHGNMETVRSFLAQVEVARAPHLARLGSVEDAPATTEEWKFEFHYHERLRALGVTLAELLD